MAGTQERLSIFLFEVLNRLHITLHPVVSKFPAVPRFSPLLNAVKPLQTTVRCSPLSGMLIPCQHVVCIRRWNTSPQFALVELVHHVRALHTEPRLAKPCKFNAYRL